MLAVVGAVFYGLAAINHTLQAQRHARRGA